jgi:hypothetical protein
MTTSAFLIVIATAVIALMFLARPLGITKIFSPAAVIFSKGVGANDSVVPEISQLASEKELIVVVNYGDSIQQDLFMNNWLLQLPAARPDSIMRWYSYYLDGSDLELVCSASTDLKQSLQVVTRDNLLNSQLEQLCNDENISVRVVK